MIHFKTIKINKPPPAINKIVIVSPDNRLDIGLFPITPVEISFPPSIIVPGRSVTGFKIVPGKSVIGFNGSLPPPIIGIF